MMAARLMQSATFAKRLAGLQSVAKAAKAVADET
jgi:hypothetical protein